MVSGNFETIGQRVNRAPTTLTANGAGGPFVARAFARTFVIRRSARDGCTLAVLARVIVTSGGVIARLPSLALAVYRARSPAGIAIAETVARAVPVPADIGLRTCAASVASDQHAYPCTLGPGPGPCAPQALGTSEASHENLFVDKDLFDQRVIDLCITYWPFSRLNHILS